MCLFFATDSKDIATEGPSISEIGNIFTKLLATKKSTTKQDEEIRLSMLSQLQLVLDRNNKPDTPVCTCVAIATFHMHVNGFVHTGTELTLDIADQNVYSGGPFFVISTAYI